MIKYIFEPVSFKQAKRFIRNQEMEEHYLLDVKNFSLTIGKGFSLKEIQFLLRIKGRHHISLLINRIFHEDELIKMKTFLASLDLTKIDFFFYSDIGFYQLAKELNIMNKLVYDAYTYLTNTQDIDLYANLNYSVVISNQLSITEMEEIANHVHKDVMIHAFGKSIILYSRRKLLTNYFQYRYKKNNPNRKDYYLQEEFRDEMYHIYEDNNGTYIYEKGYYYLYSDLNRMKNISHIIIHCADLGEKMYQKVKDAYNANSEEELLSLPLDINKGIMCKSSVLLKERGIQND